MVARVELSIVRDPTPFAPEATLRIEKVGHTVTHPLLGTFPPRVGFLAAAAAAAAAIDANTKNAQTVKELTDKLRIAETNDLAHVLEEESKLLLKEILAQLVPTPVRVDVPERNDGEEERTGGEKLKNNTAQARQAFQIESNELTGSG